MQRDEIMPPARKKNAFTLVELLVVVGIISVIVALLLPALQRARSQAQAVTCLTNMRQIALAFRMYANEHKDLLPPLNDRLYDTPFTRQNVKNVNLPAGFADPLFRSDDVTANYAYIFADYIYPYLKTKDVFQCPVPTVFPGYPQNPKEYCHYGMNRWLDPFCNRAFGYATLGRSPGVFAKIRRPGEVILLGETGIGTEVFGGFCMGVVTEFWYNNGTTPFRHGRIVNPIGGYNACYYGYQGSVGGSNMIFCDGSGRFVNGNTPGIFSSGIYANNSSTALGVRRDTDEDMQRLWIPWIR
jgi:prepilin-type N-terminal cleavage/methylation domain-containing protein